MPNVYTRTGDRGLTGLFGGSRVPKQSPAVEAYGTVDEANSSIGEAKAIATDQVVKDTLHGIQQRLFVLAAELASDQAGRDILDNTIDAADVTELEGLIDMCLEVTGPQRAFVVPGRDKPSAALHRARTVTRRAERRVLTLAQTEPVRPELITYLNRLSDTLYALARLAEHSYDLSRIEQLVRQAVARALGDPSVAGVTRFDLAATKRAAEAAEARALEVGVPIVFAAVDAGGHPLLLHRMADSLLGSIDIALNKAFTSAAFKLPTAALKDPSTPAGALHGIQHSNGGRVVVFGGGLPVFVDGLIAGGLGVSGGTVEQDVDIVTHALSVLEEQ
ncbi:cob(I)yrinic acid a,c-diamide adenosyltransferase [Micropruina sonneratiae]|uniref:cob(I)yrinic acid a,c-diamide adenosyltransferase n=1 Tax=Micropruina sonneratiae TaxID=2986940 RepID=UPI002227766F|nr:cob(I)yrinic acid a,c-diamide adenosyltransferase [Micropruina sp. KQZ13P-5]MCW3157261.1 cob(I)yrinic acid a,c-diamide adenosyltransferase [Micropruina sp. KQZ13P-5]